MPRRAVVHTAVNISVHRGRRTVATVAVEEGLCSMQFYAHFIRSSLLINLYDQKMAYGGGSKTFLLPS